MVLKSNYLKILKSSSFGTETTLDPIFTSEIPSKRMIHAWLENSFSFEPSEVMLSSSSNINS